MSRRRRNSEPSTFQEPLKDYVTELARSANEKARALGLNEKEQSELLNAVQSSTDQIELLKIKVAESAAGYRTMLESIDGSIQSKLNDTQRKKIQQSGPYRSCNAAFAEFEKVERAMIDNPARIRELYEEYRQTEMRFIDAYRELVDACVASSKGSDPSSWLPNITLPSFQLRCGGAKMPKEVFDWYNKTDDGLEDKTVFCQMPSLTQAFAEKAGEFAGRYAAGPGLAGSVGSFAGGTAANKMFAQSSRRPNPKIPEKTALAPGYSVKISKGDFVGVAKDAEKIRCNGKDAPESIKTFMATQEKNTEKAVFCKTGGAEGNADSIIAEIQKSRWTKRIAEQNFVGLARKKEDDERERSRNSEREPVPEGVQNREPQDAGGGEAAPARDAQSAKAATATPEVNQMLSTNAGTTFELLRTIPRDAFRNAFRKLGTQIQSLRLEQITRETAYDKIRNTIVDNKNLGKLALVLGPTFLTIMKNKDAFFGWSWTAAQTVATESTEPAKEAFEAQSKQVQREIAKEFRRQMQQDAEGTTPAFYQFTLNVNAIMERLAARAAEARKSTLAYVLERIEAAGGDTKRARVTAAQTAARIMQGTLEEAENMLKLVKPVLERFDLQETGYWPVAKYANIEAEFAALGAQLRNKLGPSLEIRPIDLDALFQSTRQIVNNATTAQDTPPSQVEVGAGAGGGNAAQFNLTGVQPAPLGVEVKAGGGGNGGTAPGIRTNVTKAGKDDAARLNLTRVQKAPLDLNVEAGGGGDGGAAPGIRTNVTDVGFPIKINRPIFVRYIQDYVLKDLSFMAAFHAGVSAYKGWKMLLLAQQIYTGGLASVLAPITPLIEGVMDKGLPALLDTTATTPLIEAATTVALNGVGAGGGDTGSTFTDFVRVAAVANDGGDV